MQMIAADIRRYPQFARYVSVDMPEVANVSVIVNTIRRLAGTIDRSTIRDALAWGHGPLIKIVSNLGGASTPSFGEFTPGIGSNEIRVHKELRVEPFERRDRAARGTNRSGQMVYLIGVTLLHELTHWADDQDGVDYTGRVGAGEEGDAYELLVYGQFVR